MKTIKAKPGSLPIANYFDDAVHVVLQTAPEAAKVTQGMLKRSTNRGGSHDQSQRAL